VLNSGELLSANFLNLCSKYKNIDCDLVHPSYKMAKRLVNKLLLITLHAIIDEVIIGNTC